MESGKKQTGVYLKELEWKYNNRALEPDLQAQKIIELIPMDFLTRWAVTEEEKQTVQMSA